MLSLKTLVKARCGQTSPHLNLIEELLAERGVPEPVAQLAQIMESCSAQEWCDRYAAQTGRTERSYRRDKRLAPAPPALTPRERNSRRWPRLP